MAHELQNRYSQLVDEKLRATLVTKENYIFNSNHEGDPKSGTVKIPVRDTEVTARDYNKANGLAAEGGTTNYIDLQLSFDKAVNEVIDGYDAVSVPDGIVAERLDSAAYSLGLVIEKESINVLEKANGANVSKSKTAATEATAYDELVNARTYLSRKNVPQEDRWAIVSPEYYGLLLKDDKFVRQGDLSQELRQTGALGMIAGFLVFESSNLIVDDTEITAGKKTTTEFICGHPNWCHRVEDWSVDVHIQDLSGSGKYIGASAVQGRKIFGVQVSKPETLYIKRTETAA